MPACMAAVVIKGGGYTRAPDLKRVSESTIVNDVTAFCACGWIALTAAQLILICNFVCFVVHFSMVWVTVYFHHWSEKGEKDLTLKVYRIQIAYSFTGNITADVGRPDPQNFKYNMIDNGMPIDIGVICCLFYGLSAGFHLLALVMGIFPRFHYYYWQQMDNAFCWWRWLEYTGSASIMAMGIAASLGMREENILASIFILHVCTMVCGLATEMWSRPRRVDGKMPNSRGTYPYFINFVRRCIPHAFGYVPITGAWVMMIKFLETSKIDVKKLHNRDDLEIPDWVSIVLFGTVIIFWSFGFVQLCFQYLPPNYYWGSELLYCFLSLTSKLYLGLFLLTNVVIADGSAEDILGGGGISGKTG